MQNLQSAEVKSLGNVSNVVDQDFFFTFCKHRLSFYHIHLFIIQEIKAGYIYLLSNT